MKPGSSEGNSLMERTLRCRDTFEFLTTRIMTDQALRKTIRYGTAPRCVNMSVSRPCGTTDSSPYKATVRMAAMAGFVVEVLDAGAGPHDSKARPAGGRTLARTGPRQGGNVWGECEVVFTPRMHFLMKFHNEASHWLFIDRILLE